MNELSPTFFVECTDENSKAVVLTLVFQQRYYWAFGTVSIISFIAEGENIRFVFCDVLLLGEMLFIIVFMLANNP